LATLVAKKNELKAHRVTLENDHKALQQSYDALQHVNMQDSNEVILLDRNLVKISHDLNRVSEALDYALEDEETDTTVMQEQLRTLQSELSGLKQRIKELGDFCTIGLSQVELHRLSLALKQRQDEILVVEHEREGTLNRIQESLTRTNQVKKQMNALTSEIQVVLTPQFQTLQRDVSSQIQRTEENILEGNKIASERFVVNESFEQLKKILADIQRRLQFEKSKYDGKDLNAMKLDVANKKSKHDQKE
jgi:hypothetical protein